MPLECYQWVELIDNESGEVLSGYICNLREDSVDVSLTYPAIMCDSVVTAAIPPVAESYRGYVLAN